MHFYYFQTWEHHCFKVTFPSPTFVCVPQRGREISTPIHCVDINLNLNIDKYKQSLLNAERFCVSTMTMKNEKKMPKTLQRQSKRKL